MWIHPSPQGMRPSRARRLRTVVIQKVTESRGLASDRAKLSAAFTRRGVLPESGGTWLLPRIVGWAKASEIMDGMAADLAGADPQYAKILKQWSTFREDSSKWFATAEQAFTNFAFKQG